METKLHVQHNDLVMLVHCLLRWEKDLQDVQGYSTDPVLVGDRTIAIQQIRWLTRNLQILLREQEDRLLKIERDMEPADDLPF